MENKIRGRKPKQAKTIAVDCGALSYFAAQKSGLATIAYNFLLALSTLDKRNRYVLYSFAPLNPGLVERFEGRATNKVLQPALGYLSLRLGFEFLLHHYDAFLALAQSMPTTAPATIGFVYDLAFRKYPELYKNPGKMIRNTDFLVRNSRHVVTISEFSKQDIIKTYKTKDSFVSVAYPGVDDSFRPKGQKYVDILPYFLYVGHLKKTKNLPRLVEAFGLALKSSTKKYRLVLLGNDTDLDPRISSTIARLKLADNVSIKTDVGDVDLPKYYRGALAFVSPAIHEGFGLPIVEAMASGCPVIAGDNSAMKEIVGEAGKLVDVQNVVHIVEALKQMMTDQKLRANLTRKGLKQAGQFTWKNFTRTVLNSLDAS